MASGVKPRVKVPKKAAAGDAITIKTLISHKMESGQRNANPLCPRSVSSNSLGMTMTATSTTQPKKSPSAKRWPLIPRSANA